VCDSPLRYGIGIKIIDRERNPVAMNSGRRYCSGYTLCSVAIRKRFDDPTDECDNIPFTRCIYAVILAATSTLQYNYQYHNLKSV
jgi:hypothetical protein